jgi:4-diphosphocytidyl-2-C-methyl-D-erythritol kinase
MCLRERVCSSDAAATLRALDMLFGTGLAPICMSAMAAKIGSDVPFFLSGPAAVVEGRGEIISPIAPRADLFGVLIWPGVHSSTADAYRMVDRWQEGDRCVFPAVSDLAGLYRMPASAWPFGNSFTAPLEDRYPVIGNAKKALHACGASFVEMSGSGSSVFGLFEDENEAEAALIVLSPHWQRCRKFLLLAS